MHLINNKLQIKTENGKEIRFLHTTDNHLSHADERDTERKRKLAKQRFVDFGGQNYNYENELDKAVKQASENCDLLLHTGDIIDFVSYKNLEIAQEKLSKCDYFMCAGNHEFSQYVGEAEEDEPYRNASLDLVSRYFKYDLTFASRIYNGINLVAVDNGYYYFRESQTEMLRTELEKGYPIILMLHVPLYTKELYDVMMKSHECAYLCGVPDELIEAYSPHRKEQQRTNTQTEKFINLVQSNIRAEGHIKAILAGHTHFDWEGDYHGIPQLITGGGVVSSARIIEIK